MNRNKRGNSSHLTSNSSLNMFGLSGAQWNFQSHDWSLRPWLHTKTMVLFNLTTSLIQFTAKPHKYWCWLNGEGRNRELGRGIHVLHGQNITACAAWIPSAESSDCVDRLDLQTRHLHCLKWRSQCLFGLLWEMKTALQAALLLD